MKSVREQVTFSPKDLDQVVSIYFVYSVNRWLILYMVFPSSQRKFIIDEKAPILSSFMHMERSTGQIFLSCSLDQKDTKWTRTSDEGKGDAGRYIYN